MAMKNSGRLIAVVVVILTLGGPSTASDKFAGKNTLKDLYEGLKDTIAELWHDINDPRWLAAMAFGRKASPPDEHVLRAFQQFGDALERTGMDRELRRVQQKLLTGVMGEMNKWALAEAEIGTVDALYQAFRRFQARYNSRGSPDTSRRAFMDLADTILQEEPYSVHTSLFQIHEYLTKGEEAVFQKMPQEIMQGRGSDSCITNQSPQQLVHNVYKMAFLTDMKGLAMAQFSWMISSLYNTGNYTKMALGIQGTMERLIVEKTDAARQAMSLSNNELWRCDPLYHQENETFAQLTNLLQGHIQNEIDINPKANCHEDCSYYSGNTISHVQSCYQGLFCDKQPKCTGRLIGCRFIDSDSRVCLSGRNVTNRKYDWISYKNGRTLGKMDSCPTEVARVDSWWNWLVWHCSYCFCLCDQPGPNSDRYFSLRPVLARGVDIDHLGSNRVVTGLRLIKVNRVIHLQVQDGVPLPGGRVNTTTLQWQPVKPFRVTDPGIIRGKDFHSMTWEERAIDLDDLVGPPGNVLTGVRLRVIGSNVNLEILTTPLDFETGQLGSMNASTWISNDNTPAAISNPRLELHLINPDVPIFSPIRSIMDSRNDQYIKFTHSDLDRDAAQTTVPFFDVQPVVPDPPCLLSGAGIYHKGTAHFGGFIAPKLITYDYSQDLYGSHR